MEGVPIHLRVGGVALEGMEEAIQQEGEKGMYQVGEQPLTDYRIYTYNCYMVVCKWCGVDLTMATEVQYLNGNMPVCDLCLMKAKEK